MIITDAIVIRTVDYKESDRILTLFSPDEGKIAASARGVRNKTSKLKYAAQMFNYGLYELTSAGGSVTGCTQKDGFFSVTEDVASFYAAGAGAWFLSRDETSLGGSYGELFGSFLKFMTAMKYRSSPYYALSLFLYEVGEINGVLPLRESLGSVGSGEGIFYVGRRLAGLSYGDYGRFSDEECKKFLRILEGFYAKDYGRISGLEILLNV